jgi:hypothetical protein
MYAVIATCNGMPVENAELSCPNSRKSLLIVLTMELDKATSPVRSDQGENQETMGFIFRVTAMDS